jgi:hemolysin activation/secretion protein
MMKRSLLAVFFCLIMMFYYAVAYGADEDQQAVPLFDITRFTVEGDKLLGQPKMDSLLAPFTGKQKDFGTVQEAIDALEGAYHKLGFTTIQVILPEQELEKGIIRLVIVETHIGSIKIEGNKYFSDANIRRSIPALKTGEIPNINKISAHLKTANENPVKKVAMQLESSDKENEVNAVLRVTDEKPWKVSLIGDNTGNKETGVFRTGVVLQHANIADRDHVLSLQYMTSPEKIDKVSIFGFGYHIPIYAWGDSLTFYAGYSDVDSGTIYAGTADIAVSGRGASFGGKYNQNLARIGSYEHKFIYGLDYRRYQNNATLLSTIPLDTSVTVHPASITYNGTLQLPALQGAINLTLIRNIPGGYEGADEDFRKVRAGASANYTIFRYGANVGYALPFDLQLRLVFNGQFTNDPLVPGEQFGLGGANSVRGYQEREVSDDLGNSGSIEFYSPDIFKLLNIDKGQLRFLVFYDMGEVSKVSPQPGEESYTVMSSVGAGVRLGWQKNFSLLADYGYATGLSGSRGVRNNRFHLMAVYSF